MNSVKVFERFPYAKKWIMLSIRGPCFFLEPLHKLHGSARLLTMTHPKKKTPPNTTGQVETLQVPPRGEFPKTPWDVMFVAVKTTTCFFFPAPSCMSWTFLFWRGRWILRVEISLPGSSSCESFVWVYLSDLFQRWFLWPPFGWSIRVRDGRSWSMEFSWLGILLGGNKPECSMGLDYLTVGLT